jgi:hypothetical protein
VDATAGSVDQSNFNTDFTVTGSKLFNQRLSQAQADANAASAAAAAMPSDFTGGNLTNSTTYTATAATRADGATVISLSSLNLNSKTLTLSGSSTDVFIVNISGDLLFADCKIVLSGG